MKVDKPHNSTYNGPCQVAKPLQLRAEAAVAPIKAAAKAAAAARSYENDENDEKGFFCRREIAWSKPTVCRLPESAGLKSSPNCSSKGLCE